MSPFYRAYTAYAGREWVKGRRTLLENVVLRRTLKINMFKTHLGREGVTKKNTLCTLLSLDNVDNSGPPLALMVEHSMGMNQDKRMLISWLCSKVTVLEARDRLGGRVWDDYGTGVCVGRGAQIVNGTTNNPISLLCHQVSRPFDQS